jgi:hypothetical protein
MPAGFTDFRGNRHNSLDVLQWITENVPCFTGMVPREWTQAVYAESRSRAINWEVARQAMIWASRSGYRFDFSTGVATDAVVYMSKAEKLKAGIEHSVKYLPGNLKSVGQALVEPKALAIMVGTLLAWAASHAFGIGEVIDLVLLGIGVLSVGFSIFSGAGQLVEFVETALDASSDADLDEAGQHFARALVILGIATIQALLLRGPVKAARARYANPARVGPAPPPGTPPTTTSEPTLPNNALGSTDAYGNIKISLQQSAASAKETLLHELVHRFFSPRFALLRRFRAQLNIDAYARSWLMRYLEETMAEGFAQLRANGLLASFKAIYFPITEGYVTLSQVVNEGNVIGTLTLAGRRIYVIVSTGKIPADAQ